MGLSFLKKVAQVTVKAAEVAAGVGPIFSRANPKAEPVITKVVGSLGQLADIVQTVETVGQVLGTPGADKLRAALPLVTDAVLKSDVLVGKKIQDPILFRKAVEELAQGVVDLLNSVEHDEPAK